MTSRNDLLHRKKSIPLNISMYVNGSYSREPFKWHCWTAQLHITLDVADRFRLKASSLGKMATLACQLVIHSWNVQVGRKNDKQPLNNPSLVSTFQHVRRYHAWLKLTQQISSRPEVRIPIHCQQQSRHVTSQTSHILRTAFRLQNHPCSHLLRPQASSWRQPWQYFFHSINGQWKTCSCYIFLFHFNHTLTTSFMDGCIWKLHWKMASAWITSFCDPDFVCGKRTSAEERKARLGIHCHRMCRQSVACAKFNGPNHLWLKLVVCQPLQYLGMAKGGEHYLLNVVEVMSSSNTS